VRIHNTFTVRDY